MTDRKKVIKGLTAIEDEAYDRWVHRQYIKDPLITLIRDNVPDALALLREQEPVKPKREVNENGQILSCGNCGAWFAVQKQKYCHECGREVKWDDAE